MPRFVLLKHSLPPESLRATHWDFMLEAESGLRTWALAELPLADRVIAATQLAEHRLAYLHYEGEVSGNRGRVERVDEGEYSLAAEAAGRVEVLLRGKRYRGRATLCAVEGDQRWSFVLVAEADLSTAATP